MWIEYPEDHYRFDTDTDWRGWKAGGPCDHLSMGGRPVKYPDDRGGWTQPRYAHRQPGRWHGEPAGRFPETRRCGRGEPRSLAGARPAVCRPGPEKDADQSGK